MAELTTNNPGEEQTESQKNDSKNTGKVSMEINSSCQVSSPGSPQEPQDCPCPWGQAILRRTDSAFGYSIKAESQSG
jgi:hypothetical protein